MSEITLPSLPYAKNDLQPYVSSDTLDYHHGKHHKAYVDNLNNLLLGTELRSKSLEEIIMRSANDSAMQGIFNNAAQVWNHTFYWHSMMPKGGGSPKGSLLQQITKDFGSFEEFKIAFKQGGATQFGSGWVWLCWDAKAAKLVVIKTANADLPMVKGLQALLTADVWEHAYYLDYQNRRPDYLDVFLNNLANWDFASANFDNVEK